MLDVCAVGDLKWLFWLAHIPLPLHERTILDVKVTKLLGNDAPIVALLAAYAGMRCCLLPTNIIAQKDGQPLLDLLQQAGVDISFIDTSGISTPYTFGLFDSIFDKRAWLINSCTFHFPFSRLPTCAFLYIDLYEDYLEERFEILRLYSRSKLPMRSLVNLSATNYEMKLEMLASLPIIDTIQMSSTGDTNTALEQGRLALHICNVQAAVVTAGKNGAVLVERSTISGMPHHEYVVQAQSIQPMRTIGAGASFSANYLLALNENKTYEQSVRAACVASAAFCASRDNPLEVLQ